MRRDVQAELLDTLPAEDPRAIQSRADLRRVNWWMGHAGWMSRRLRDIFGERPPQSVVELGGGDGSLLLRLAARLAPRWKPVRAVLVDQQRLLGSETQSRFEALGWPVECIEGDVFDWLERADAEPCDVCFANLFLHHFQDDRLRRLLALAARQTGVFLACEPRRGRFTLAATGLLPLVGCNDVSVHDGRISVRAGFAGRELSALWPAADGQSTAQDQPQAAGWRLTEKPAGLFSHCFLAQRIFLAQTTGGEQEPQAAAAPSQAASRPSR